MSSSSGGSESIHQQRMLLRGVPGREAESAGRPEGSSSLRNTPSPRPPGPSSNLQQQRRLQAEPLPLRNLPEVGVSWHCAMYAWSSLSSAPAPPGCCGETRGGPFEAWPPHHLLHQPASWVSFWFLPRAKLPPTTPLQLSLCTHCPLHLPFLMVSFPRDLPWPPKSVHPLLGQLVPSAAAQHPDPHRTQSGCLIPK